MKVLIVVPAMAELYGGPTKIAREFAAALARRGVSVDIITTDAAGAERANVRTNDWTAEKQFRLRYVRRLGRSEFKFSPQLMNWLWAHVARYDIVHILSDFNFPVLAAALICRLCRVPYIVNPQGMLEPWALLNKGGKKALYYKLIERPLVLRGAAVIHALSKAEAANIDALHLTRDVVVIPNGVELDLGDSQGAADAFIRKYPRLAGKRLILFLHRIDPKKGLDILARAFARAANRITNLHLVVAGPDTVNYWSTAGELFAKEGCSDKMTYTGMLTGDDKARAFAACELFVAPSYSEGFSMSILEAMAAGKPCVITVGCNFPEATEAGAALQTPPDAEAFAQAMIEVMDTPGMGTRMGRRGRELVETNYSWAHVAESCRIVFEKYGAAKPLSSWQST